MTPLITIVVPVYNCEDEIKKCIGSILAQTYCNLELILVDDGSPDRSGQICDDIAEKDSRIKVYHKQNGGVSSARNFGLDHTNGDFICFVDSDDYVEDHYIEDFVDGLTDDSVDIVFQGINEIKPNGQIVKKIPIEGHYAITNILNGISDVNKLLMFGYVCNKLYRTRIINKNNLRFNLNINISEDRIFALQYFNFVNEMQIVAKSSYNYKIKESGLTQKKRNYAEIKKAADANLYAALELLKTRTSERFLYDTKRMYVMSSYDYLRELFQGGYLNCFVRKEYLMYLYEFKGYQKAYKPDDRSHKVIQYICRICPNILSYVLMFLYWKRKK